MSASKILLIRHAQSTWNADGRWQGHADPPLSALGRAQAEALAARLATTPFDLVVASDLRRAFETARIVAGQRGLAPTSDPRFRELDLGEWTGLRREQVAERWPAEYARFESGVADARPVGGESRRELGGRALAALEDWAVRQPARRLAVVSPAGVIRSLCGERLENAESLWFTPARWRAAAGG